MPRTASSAAVTEDRRRSRAQRQIRAVKSQRAKSEQAEQQVNVEEILDAYDETFLECRRANLGHAWKRIGYWNEGWRVVKLLQCQRCSSSRRVVMRNNGALIESKYDYADGYQMKGVGRGGIANEQLRLEDMKRAQIWASEHEMMEALKKPRRGRKVS